MSTLSSGLRKKTLDGILSNKGESGSQVLQFVYPFDERDVAADKEISPVTLHLCIHAYGTISGEPAYATLTPDLVCYTVACEKGPKRRIYVNAPLELGWNAARVDQGTAAWQSDEGS